MKSAGLVFSLVAFLPAAAWAQSLDTGGTGPSLTLEELRLHPSPDSEIASPDPLLPSSLVSTELVQQRFGHVSISLAAFGRVSFPGSGDVSPDAGVSYQDLFSPGVGGSFEGDLLLGVGGGLHLGGYASVGYDVFGGRSITDDFGNKLDADDMRIITAFIGGKIKSYHGPWFFWEGRLGLGLIHYNAVNATITDFGFPPENDRLFRATTRGAFEVGALAGWGTQRFAVELGLEYRLFGAPQRGENISSLVDPDPFDTFDVSVGFRLIF